jgi:hypothetical protein
VALTRDEAGMTEIWNTVWSGLSARVLLLACSPSSGSSVAKREATCRALTGRATIVEAGSLGDFGDCLKASQRLSETVR